MAKYDKERYTNSNKHWNVERRSERDGFGSRTRVWDKRTGKRYHLDEKGLSIVQRNEARETRSKAFTTILFIVLFTVFAGTFATIPQPANKQAVDTPVEAQNYISSISSQVGTSAKGSISFVVNLIEPLAQGTQTLVEGFTYIVGGIYEVISWFIPIDSITGDCISYDDLTIPQKINFQVTWAAYRLANWEIQEIITQDFYLNIWAQNNAIDKVVCSS